MKYKIDDLVVIPKSVLESIILSKGILENLKKEDCKALLQQVMSLKPLIEQSFDAGGAYAIGSHRDFQQIHPNKQTYLEKEIEL